MTNRRMPITLEPNVLLWARERAGISRDDLAHKMKVKIKRVREWEETGRISIAQVDRLAERTHTPLGFLLLSEPPEDILPISDFRTRRGNAPPALPSVDLLETVYAMQRRQAWMREELIEGGAEPLGLVGAYSLGNSHMEVAGAMRDALGLAERWAEDQPTWTDALGHLRDSLNAAGVLVAVNGIVGNNTRRQLDPGEFQGFALVDEYAPLIFVNNADFMAAKMFTFAHELAHLFVGESGVSHFERLQPSQHSTEQFCNQAAAEFLVSESSLRQLWPTVSCLDDPYKSVARRFKVSAIVAARRALDLDLIDRDTFFEFYDRYKHQGANEQTTSSGGNFWYTQRWRIGPRFAGAVVRATKEGRLTYREAYSLTGLSGETFDNLAVKMDVIL